MTAERQRLTPAEAYRRWAPTYEGETAVSALEARIVQGLAPPSSRRRLLDVGCGVARRLHLSPDEAPAFAVGLDLVPEMLRAARVEGRPLLVAGDVRGLPFAERSFDALWCRLVLGHVRELEACYAEMARVARPPASLIVTDFHPAAAAAGHRRSFRDASGRSYEIEHCAHAAADHLEAASRSGWTLGARVDAPAGEPERPFYERAGRLRQFEEEAALPLVLAMSFER